MEYHVVTAGDPGTLENLVEANMRIGWLPCGGISVTKIGNDEMLWAQAMTLIHAPDIKETKISDKAFHPR